VGRNVETQIFWGLAMAQKCQEKTSPSHHLKQTLLVGGIPLQKMMDFVSWDDDIPN